MFLFFLVFSKAFLFFWVGLFGFFGFLEVFLVFESGGPGGGLGMFSFKNYA